MEKKEIKGTVFNIQRFSLHDGPGIRTVVFLKGCPLNCLWCSNPESQDRKPQIMFLNNICIRCYRCVESCPLKAISEPGNINKDLCNLCGKCIKVCPKKALKIVGEEKTVVEVLGEVEKDETFYRRSGGGLTLSGGEPLNQFGFSLSLARTARKKGYNTALETSGFCNFDKLAQILPYIDCIMYDIKCIDSKKHEELTELPNNLILDNLKKLMGLRSDVIIRVPIIPTYNNGKGDLKKMAEFIKSLDIKKIQSVDLLPFHQYGRSKYEMLGINYQLAELDIPGEGEMDEIKRLFERDKIPIRVMKL